ncbi:MAG: FAD-dependent oxidoreductase [Sphingomonas sp.]|nr:FAD-dependent oxidoreductase [Sphingomonas sp.]
MGTPAPDLDSRRDQMFPTLTAAQIEVARRFAAGEPRSFKPGETMFALGERNVPSWLVLEGAIDVVRRDGLGHEAHIVSHHAGQISGEINQLGGRATLAEGVASEQGCTAIPFDAPHLRALLIGSADLGELIMRAFILRRVGLINADNTGSVLVGRPDDPDLVRLQGFLTRNGYPNSIVDTDTQEGRDLLDKLAVPVSDLPLMICPNGTVLKQPSDAEAATCLGITPELDANKVYDVIVTGAGPAGLATAVYGASEGLSVLVLDTRAFGGQAGASARIENYLGFPTGISGQALAGRAFTQASKFGAELAIPITADKLHCDETAKDGGFRVDLSNGMSVRGRTIVIASGARYRRPDVAKLEELEGAGISYWASPIEAKLCAGEEIALVGGGNSAGQACVFLAPQVEKLNLIVRRPLEATMSKYLIDRIKALPNVALHIGKEVVALDGDRAKGLQGVTFRCRTTGSEHHCDLNHLFLFIGADPNTDWLDGCVDLDAKGFVVTGRQGSAPLETSRPGIFAAGDVRCGSTKRVAAAVGEGAAVIAQVHAYLAQEVTGA